MKRNLFICVFTYLCVMPNLTLAIPKDTFDKMKQHSEFRWSEVARKAIEEKLDDAELLEDLKCHTDNSLPQEGMWDLD